MLLRTLRTFNRRRGPSHSTPSITISAIHSKELPQQRLFATEASPSGQGGVLKILAAVGLAGAAYYAYTLYEPASTPAQQNDLEAVRKDIENLLDSNPKYDDGSYAPLLLRLAWHSSGTYDIRAKNGGSDGATMRFHPESEHGANAGLDVGRKLLEPIHKKYPGLSISDLWILAGCVSIEHMGGPKINFRTGRSDKKDGSFCPPNGRLPDGDKGPAHIREIFYRQGFNDQEIVALIGAHCVGRCHSSRSGFEGPWTNSPTTFSNDFFVQLLERKWTLKKWDGPIQYEDETGMSLVSLILLTTAGTLMMLPADVALIQDPEFKKWVEIYAKDEDRFFADFAPAFQKLTENGFSPAR